MLRSVPHCRRGRVNRRVWAGNSSSYSITLSCNKFLKFTAYIFREIFFFNIPQGLSGTIIGRNSS